MRGLLHDPLVSLSERSAPPSGNPREVTAGWVYGEHWTAAGPSTLLPGRRGFNRGSFHEPERPLCDRSVTRASSSLRPVRVGIRPQLQAPERDRYDLLLRPADPELAVAERVV